MNADAKISEVEMENQTKNNRIHPLMAVAAVSVMLASLIGIAAITGVLPNSHSTTAPLAATTLTGTNTTANAAPAVATAPEDVPHTLAESATKEEKAKSTTAPAVASSPIEHKSVAPKTVHRTTPRASTPVTVAKAQQICESCGIVESVRAVQQAAKPSGLGVVAGAVLGGVLGNQVGNGNGRTLATVAGAVGGGYAGNEVEKRTRTNTGYEVRVRMEDGSIRTFTPAGQPDWRAGDRVRIVNGELTSRG
jgi:outer membrane lipoprotein SlyB